MARQLTPREVRELAAARRVAEDSDCHILDHGFRLYQVILALENCFRVQVDGRAHKGRVPPGNAYRADCHYLRADRMRVDFTLAETPGGEVILVVTAFLMDK